MEDRNAPRTDGNKEFMVELFAPGVFVEKLFVKADKLSLLFVPVVFAVMVRVGVVDFVVELLVAVGVFEAGEVDVVVPLELVLLLFVTLNGIG